MAVLPLAPIFEELRLTVTSAEIVLLSLKYDTEIVHFHVKFPHYPHITVI